MSGDAETLAEVLSGVIDGAWVTDSEHDPGCFGGGDYCGAHCPVPVQREVSIAEIAAALAAHNAAIRAEALETEREQWRQWLVAVVRGEDAWPPGSPLRAAQPTGGEVVTEQPLSCPDHPSAPIGYTDPTGGDPSMGGPVLIPVCTVCGRDAHRPLLRAAQPTEGES